MEWSLADLNKSKKNRRAFTPDEDEALKQAVEAYGEDNDWAKIAKHVAGRNPRQCRERWTCYLRPSLTSKPWTKEEDNELLSKYYNIGPKWTYLTSFLPKRSAISIKSRYKALEHYFHLGVPQHAMLVPMFVSHQPQQAYKVIDTCQNVDRRSQLNESSPEASAQEIECITTQHELEVFFNTLPFDHFHNTPKFLTSLI